MNKQQLETEFVNLIEEYKRIIYKVCFIYSNDDENLNDLYQEIIINLWRSYPNFRNECKISTWIYRISLNTCISFYRKAKAKPDIIPLSMNIELVEEENKTEQIRELYQMINRLGKMERALILLWLEEKSYQEIAVITGLSRNNVAVKLNRIREKLKRMTNN